MYVPNSSDKKKGLNYTFGASTMIINGGIECTTSNRREHAGSLSRIEYYKQFLNYFGLKAETGLGCATMKPFDAHSSSSYP